MNDAYVVFRDNDPKGRYYLNHGWWSLKLSYAQIFETREQADVEAKKYEAKTGLLCVVEDDLTRQA